MTDAAIDRVTALRWTKDAIDSFRAFARTGDSKWLVRAMLHRDEALEHAAKVGDEGHFLGQVQRLIDRVALTRNRRRRQS